jgi:cytochrome c oxidase subunit II
MNRTSRRTTRRPHAAARPADTGRVNRARSWLGCLSLFALSGCGGGSSALTGGGPAATTIASLTWVLVGILAAVYLVVMAALIHAVSRGRRHTLEPGAPRADRGALVAMVTAGAIIPFMVLTALLLATLHVLAVVLPVQTPDALAIEVRGQQWWWEFEYGGDGGAVRTANELHIPTGRRVILRLHAYDVIHSLWVPALQGKLDLIPGKTNVTWLQADRPGIYRGQCAEFCGIQHAQMAFVVIAHPPAAFDAWLLAERRPSVPPADDQARRGERLFVDRGCASCHTIRGGLAFFGRFGPDLTHVASRRTLAAGVLDNSRGSLAGWIANPQTLKPGSRMPHTPLAVEDFHAIVHYVSALR